MIANVLGPATRFKRISEWGLLQRICPNNSSGIEDSPDHLFVCHEIDSTADLIQRPPAFVTFMHRVRLVETGIEPACLSKENLDDTSSSSHSDDDTAL